MGGGGREKEFWVFSEQKKRKNLEKWVKINVTRNKLIFILILINIIN